jgi:hypothetical protein
VTGVSQASGGGPVPASDLDHAGVRAEPLDGLACGCLRQRREGGMDVREIRVVEAADRHACTLAAFSAVRETRGNAASWWPEVGEVCRWWRLATSSPTGRTTRHSSRSNQSIGDFLGPGMSNSATGLARSVPMRNAIRTTAHHPPVHRPLIDAVQGTPALPWRPGGGDVRPGGLPREPPRAGASPAPMALRRRGLRSLGGAVPRRPCSPGPAAPPPSGGSSTRSPG